MVNKYQELKKLEKNKKFKQSKNVERLLLSHDGQALRELREFEKERN